MCSERLSCSYEFRDFDALGDLHSAYLILEIFMVSLYAAFTFVVSNSVVAFKALKGVAAIYTVLHGLCYRQPVHAVYLRDILTTAFWTFIHF